MSNPSSINPSILAPAERLIQVWTRGISRQLSSKRSELVINATSTDLITAFGNYAFCSAASPQGESSFISTARDAIVINYQKDFNIRS